MAEAGISRRDVELALELGDAAGITQELRDQVARYNAEDCASTESLRDWLEARRAERIAAGCVIERPRPQDAAPPENAAARDQRIEAIRAALVAKVGPDPAQWSDVERAISQLASMMGYFRQEAKNASPSRDSRTRYHSEPRTVATTSDPDPSIARTAPPRKYRLPLVRVRSETSRASPSASPIVGGVHCKGLF